MLSNPALSAVLQLHDEVSIEETGDGGVLSTPAGARVRVTARELSVLLAFRTANSVIRVLTMIGPDEECPSLSDKVNEWLDLGVLRISHTTHGSTPIVTLASSESSNVFFVYTGTQGGVMMNPLDFLQQSGLSNQNVVLLRDPSQTWFLNGVSDRITTVGELVAWQSGFLAGAAHTTNHYCIGSSMGAFSAMVFGHVLKARAVWSFGLARTTVPVGDSQGQPWNLESLLSSWNGVTSYHLYFNDSWARDREAAMRLEHLPGVELYPQGGAGHVVLEHLIAVGELSRLFPGTVSRASKSRAVDHQTVVSESAVLSVLRSILPKHSDVPDATTRLAGILDSFALVVLLESLATDLGVTLDPDRLTPADFETVTAITKAIARESTSSR